MGRHISKKQIKFELSTQTKECYKCGEYKDFSEFRKSNGRYGIANDCKDCFREYQRQYHKENYDELKSKRIDYYNSEETKKKRSKYIRSESYKESQRKYLKKRRNSDPLFRATRNIRKRTRKAFSRTYWSKTSSTRELLGCDYHTAFNHIENKFKEGMSWNNYGKWHIDHITPLCSATTVEELKALCHYTNLQPLWAEENILKGGKMPDELF